LPSFNISIADFGTNTANVSQPRAIFFDIYTTPGSIYEPMEIEIDMPETVLGNNIPAAVVCSVQMFYVGVYSVCAQQLYVNNMNNDQINYNAK
jgi:hypothetical protein